MGSVNNPAALPTFYELAGGENHQVTAASTWEDWDISAIVPTGVTRVLMEFHSAAVAINPGGARANGSAIARYFYIFGATQSVVVETKVDTSRILELYDASAGHGMLASVIGYWL